MSKSAIFSTAFAASISSALVAESQRALERWQSAGERVTPESAPLLMMLWRATCDELTATKGATRLLEGPRFGVDSLWDERGRLNRFYLRDSHTGVLLLSGDANGPAFPVRGEALAARLVSLQRSASARTDRTNFD